MNYILQVAIVLSWSPRAASIDVLEEETECLLQRKLEIPVAPLPTVGVNQLTSEPVKHSSSQPGNQSNSQPVNLYQSGNQTVNLATEAAKQLSEQSRPSVFCWMVETPSDLTALLARQQLAECDDYAVFSNYSDTLTKTVKIFDGLEMAVGVTKHGWANNSQLFKKIYNSIIASDLPEKYQWFVKIDPDSFFRARFLRDVLTQYDASKPCAIGRRPQVAYDGNLKNPRISGSMEIVSHKAFRDNRTDVFLATLDEDGTEDTLLARGFLKAGFDIHVHAPLEICNDWSLDYPNLPKNERLSHEKWNTSIIVDTMEKLLFNASVPWHCMYIGRVKGHATVIHRNVIVVHPVKNVSAYGKLQVLDKVYREQT